SLGAVALGRPDVYFDVSVAVVLAVSVGGYVEDRVKARALDVLESRLEASVDVARTVEGCEIGVEDVDGGDRLLVRRGERFPVDGVVVEGDGHVDESVVTGVSRPIRRREGDDVLGGSVALDSAFEVEAGDGGSTLDRLTDVVRSTHASSPGVQRLTDRLSTAFVPVVLGLSAMSFAGWLYLTGEFETSLLTALVVLVVSCPCALGVAGPLARAAGVRSALEARVVVTDDSVFERVEDVEHVVFDKTGTLTRGEMDVAVVHGDDEAVEMAAAVESYDDRPHARAFDAVADGGGDVDGFEALDRGVLGYVEGHEVFAGHPDIAVERDVDFDGFRDAVDDVESDGLLPVVVSVDGRVRAVAGLGDSVAEGWRDVVEFVAGDDVRLMTGDDRATPEFDGVFDEVYRGLPPEAKAEAVERLSADGGVCFVGDGVNDGPALASADVGVCLGRAALTVESADATSLDGLDGLREFLRVSRATRRRIRENVGWALVYNAVAVPLAVAGVINPLFAAVAMASSSLLVVANSSRRL
ncbi:MAG: heavy metal translocating P-type ATPase, partial [Halobacteriota archaeon]